MTVISADKNTDITPRWWMHLAWWIPILCGLYLAVQLQRSTYGLPIDDAYIYVQYIDNISQGNGYSFNSGETSFGVTSFLFTILGAAVKILFPWLDTLLVCQYLGMLSMVFLVWGVQRVIYSLTANFSMSWIAGGFLVFCRPMYFTAASGLETSLFLCAAVWVLVLGLRRSEPNWVVLGLVCALLYLSRPEGLYFTMAFSLGLCLYPFIYDANDVFGSLRKIGARFIYFAAGFSMMAAPYLCFVKWYSGRWMPMTFYGKLINRSNFSIEPWHQKIRVGFFVLLEGYKQIVAQDILPIFIAVSIALAFLSYAMFFFQSGKKRPHLTWFSVRFAMIGFCVYPFLYGAVFRTSPVFGGFFIRYIQICLVLIYIESALAVNNLFVGLSNLLPKEIVRTWLVRVMPFIFLPLLFYTAKVSVTRLHDDDIDFYKSHVSVNEKVRKWAGRWIDENAPPNARVFTSNSGLGAVGVYCNRFVRDEAGLINSNIYPYLLGYSQGFYHWFKMLEYMKAQHIDYLTTLPPYGGETRHTQTVAEFQEPSLKGTDLERMSRIRISRFIAPETYDLWAEYETEAVFVDRADSPNTEDRVRVTRWNDEPVVAVRTLADQVDIRQRMLYPTHARFTSGIAFDSSHDFGPEDKAIVEIKVNYTGQPVTVFTKTYPLQSVERRVRVDGIDVDLEKYGGKYAFFLYGVRVEGPSAAGVWTGWIEPKLVSTNASDSD